MDLVWLLRNNDVDDGLGESKGIYPGSLSGRFGDVDGDFELYAPPHRRPPSINKLALILTFVEYPGKLVS